MLKIIDSSIEQKFSLLGSLLEFTRVFFKLRTGRDFIISHPIGRESHYITICRELVKILRLEELRLIINVPPGHAKSTLLQHFVAWSLAHFPDSQILYISYSKSLAEKHTATIKKIMELPHYKKIFDVYISQDSSAKGNFKTTAGGSVMAFGSGGSITGQDAGLPNLNRFSGMIIIDDPHKPDEVHSDIMREAVIQNYNETIKPRPRGPNVPIVFIGQRLHEYDLPAYLINGNDGFQWKKVILKAIDEAGNALCPNINSLQMLKNEQITNPYVFSAQFQQDPQPSGGGIFKPEWFILLEEDPKILSTFITCDTAETNKNYNDATVFSFFGIYKILHEGRETDIYGLHWINCVEIRVEPKDLKNEFMDFYGRCCDYICKPKIVAIEKKSTGVTLSSILGEYQGLQIINIERSRASGNKTTRFLEVQPFVAAKQISFPIYSKHSRLCIEHMRKITANNTHAHDDICDTLTDAIKLVLIDKILVNKLTSAYDYSNAAKLIFSHTKKVNDLRLKSYQ